jgi:ornithine carbamoyltransferase
MKKDFLCLTDITPEEGWKIIKNSLNFKKNPSKIKKILLEKNIGLLFFKPSTRTRVSFEVAINKLGGNSIYMTTSQLQISRGEEIKDTARTLSGYLDGLVIRAFSHTLIEEFAYYSRVPVINALTDFSHPCQILADVLTLYEMFGENIKKLKIAFVGDGNNVANSLMVGAGLFGLKLVVATPSGYEPNAMAYKKALDLCKQTGGEVEITNNLEEAIKDADVIYTDVWFSMGENAQEEKEMSLKPFQVNRELISKTGKSSIVFHCLPAKKGQEITEEIFEENSKIIFLQAENRLWSQMALLYFLFSNDNS